MCCVCAYPNDRIQFLHSDLFGALNSRRNLLLMLQHIIVTTDVKKTFFMVALWNRADHYIFALWFLLSLWSPYGIGRPYIFSCSGLFFFLLSFFFFPRLISAAADWMSAILPHMVWP